MGGDVIKPLLKLLRPRRTEYRMVSDSENVVTKKTKKKRPYPTDVAVRRNGIGRELIYNQHQVHKRMWAELSVPILCLFWADFGVYPGRLQTKRCSTTGS